MKRLKTWVIGAAVLALGLILATQGDVVLAGLRTGGGWTNFPGKVQLGDNIGRDTVDVSGFLEVDSTAGFAELTISGGLLTADSVLVNNLVKMGGSSVIRADSVYFNEGVLFAKGQTVFCDSFLIFKNGRIDLDSMRVDTVDIITHATVAALTASGTVTANGDLTIDGGILTADSANIDSVDIGSHITAALLTTSGLATLTGATIDGAILTADSANVDSIDVASHATVAALTASGVLTANDAVTIDGGLLTADSINVDSIDVATHATIGAITATSLTATSVGADSIAVDIFTASAGKGAGAAISMDGIVLTADTILSDSIGVAKIDVKTLFHIGGVPAVFPIEVALDDDSLGDPGPHLAMTMPRQVAVRYAVLDLSEAVGAQNCTLWVKSTTDSAALIVLVGTDDTVMTCDVTVNAGTALDITSAIVTGSDDGAAAGTDAPDLVIWCENK